MEDAFAAGYDPALELAKVHTPRRSDSDGEAMDDDAFDDHGPWTENLRRKEQDAIDHIVHGDESGHYFMLLGPKVICPIFQPILSADIYVSSKFRVLAKVQ